MKTKELASLFGLAALWGSSFLFVRLASPAIGPVLTAQGRVTIAAAALLIYIFVIGKSTQFKQYWRHYIIIGALNAAIPFTLVSFAALHLNSSMMAIINSLTPLFTALVVWGWMKEKVSIKKCAGIFIGISGVVILVGWSPLPLTVDVLAAAGFSILSTVSYGFGGVYAKLNFSQIPPQAVAFGQQMGASLLIFPFTLFTLPESTSAVTPTVAWSVVGVALLSTALGYILYYYLITNVGPTKTVSVTFLIPLFGMIWAVVFLHEQITTGMIVGLIVILSSIFLISDVQT
ncbi:DMT family transporter [Peribacillus deserti]|uniref:EamA family transporter n=1 Tax=Peribacillus deserti TaxID=673318 RepID=A0A2N5M179_9BACI|nr:DMT family transporter [Peribacillus deserti]PLT28111.1 EamA family transporter [Peribacillus deserti]